MSLSNLQIDRFFKNNKYYGGCYSKDELTKMRPENKFYIVNLQDSNKGNGTHWTMIWNCNMDACYYFDSYGIVPPRESKDFMKRSGKKLWYNTRDIQSLTSQDCGEYCIIVILKLMQGEPFRKVVNDFNLKHPADNDRLARELILNKIK